MRICLERKGGREGEGGNSFPVFLFFSFFFLLSVPFPACRFRLPLAPLRVCRVGMEVRGEISNSARD